MVCFQLEIINEIMWFREYTQLEHYKLRTTYIIIAFRRISKMSSAVTCAALGQLQRLGPRASFRVISTTTTKCVSDKRFDSTEEMVSASPLPLRKSKGSRPWDSSTSAWGRRKHFVDWMKVRVKAGDGGDGRINLMHRYRIDHAGATLYIQV